MVGNPLNASFGASLESTTTAAPNELGFESVSVPREALRSHTAVIGKWLESLGRVQEKSSGFEDVAIPPLFIPKSHFQLSKPFAHDRDLLCPLDWAQIVPLPDTPDVFRCVGLKGEYRLLVQDLLERGFHPRLTFDDSPQHSQLCLSVSLRGNVGEETTPTRIAITGGDTTESSLD